MTKSEIQRKKERKKRVGNNRIGSKHSKETKRKIGLANSKKTRTQETKDKISNTLKGRTISQIIKDKISITMKLKGLKPPSSLGLKRSEETKKKLSILHKGKPRLSIRGEKNCNWKGGITPENMKIRHSLDAKLWRDAVFARDGYTCQKTGQIGGKLRCHHILNFSKYPELRFAIDNGITLSDEAHKEFHRKYGIKNNNKEQIEEFLNGNI